LIGSCQQFETAVTDTLKQYPSVERWDAFTIGAPHIAYKTGASMGLPRLWMKRSQNSLCTVSRPPSKS
jgi:hypothetical protein